MTGCHVCALLAALALPGCVQVDGRGRGAQADEGRGARATPDLESARELDQSGVRVFKEGHFADAIRFFRAAYRKGGPSSELWNVARCEEHLDDGERAARSIEQYLAQRDLVAAERAEGERELRALTSRPSLLTLTTVPPGAVAVIDGKQPLGPTPLSVELTAGDHTLTVEREGFARETRPLTARFGRAVIVSLDLARVTR